MAIDSLHAHEGSTWLPRPRVFGLAIGAGQLAGLVMAIVVMFVFVAFLHHSIFFPVQLMGSLFLGESHLQDAFSPGPFLLGFVAHQLGPSLIWSLIFAVVLLNARQAWSLSELLMLGFCLGGVAEIVDVYVVMPLFQHSVNGQNLWAMNVPRFWDWAAHFVFGLSLGGIYYALREGAAHRSLQHA
jgi:hypothetical protein